MGLSLITPPATEPLTLTEVKVHCRVDRSGGEPAPTAITAALAGLGTGALSNGSYRYLATYVTADGETEAGQISAACTVADHTVNGQIALTGIPIGGSAVTSRNLYRTAAGGLIYLLLGSLPNNTASVFADNVADGSLGVQAPVTNTTADPAYAQWITAARQYVETFTHRALITQTWQLQLDGFPWQTLNDTGVGSGVILVPKPPCQTVSSITYVDMNGVTQTWDPTLYTVDNPQGPWARVARIVPAYFQIYPVTRWVPNAATVQFVCGYGTAAQVPAPMKSAMKLLIGNWYLNREAGEIIRGSADVLPFGVEALLWPFKSF